MKLAALGLVTAAIGLILSESGLVAVGVLWVVLGPIMRQHGRRLEAKKDATGQPDISGRTFALGTLLWLALGVPSLLVGLLKLGISPEHENWRWLPIVIGVLALGIGGLGGLLYATGSAIGAVTGTSTPPTVPATIRIRSSKETGTFINERPRLELELTVEPEAASGLASYEVTKLATVPFTALGSLRVGDGFAALVVGPNEPTAMEIHWDQPISAQGSPEESVDVPARLAELDRLHRAGKVTDDEYNAQRERILGSL
ncbi:MFS family permease [Aeromicrobium panaciterrae]|uniref:MFS family permease n=1 Tax=Aeromicrobium panaciterrae TaxID=363861 RepID=A0ABU1UQX0_9ACTN|nr:SHOCT domain-containing protein [Aeromicrobium panaciterrae]MDR7087588.1 MFS family permease [Aeromicrobium panaciterrae]